MGSDTLARKNTPNIPVLNKKRCAVSIHSNRGITMTHSSAADKKAWEHPQLIVLIRNNPEEAVLSYCKSTIVGTSPRASANLCSETINFACNQCSAPTAS